MSAVFGLRLAAGGVEARVTDGWATHLRQFT